MLTFRDVPENEVTWASCSHLPLSCSLTLHHSPTEYNGELKNLPCLNLFFSISYFLFLPLSFSLPPSLIPLSHIYGNKQISVCLLVYLSEHIKILGLRSRQIMAWVDSRGIRAYLA